MLSLIKDHAKKIAESWHVLHGAQQASTSGKSKQGDHALYQSVEKPCSSFFKAGLLPAFVINDKSVYSQHHAALRRQETAYQSLVDNLPQGLITFCKSRISSANPSACCMLGNVSGQQLATLDLSRFVPPSNQARELDRLHALQQGLIKGQQARLLKLRRLDGSEFDAEITEVLVEGDDGRDVQWLLRDVTQDQMMRLELEEANKQLKYLSQRLIEIQEVERRQIARDLHDDIGQQLTGLKLHLQRLIRKLDNQEAIAITDGLVEGTDQALAKVRRLSLSLHPLQLETLGLEAALRWHLSHFLEATPTVWELQIQGLLETISPAKAVAAFRIVQEAVNNATKHAQADNLRIMLSRDEDGLRLEILDDGCGFDTSDVALGTQSLGLTSMRERVASLGGHLTINSLEGIGTRVTAWLPSQRGA
ncbi:histidine kinase [Halomonas sp. McH1-25]|uniref:PAS domain-containing sensor histidine kinase n=1 Tax=unclassified Halomonas TaxID=2609666 RepID=UPI001EF61DD8|nr:MULTISPECIES: ATP-binding protein [unclassified Halomonas]MCG7601116.1 histidine kinase [Halomonas sp. McH1-25]MCP1342986.1 histidine kinase [Halomonas sp. FL8]MCP1360838.1 histidine kinase [Halomonas sp. BBD45]MCP1363671.1 histidine kinase [Halomonas sp. BBD48]